MRLSMMIIRGRRDYYAVQALKTYIAIPSEFPTQNRQSAITPEKRRYVDLEEAAVGSEFLDGPERSQTKAEANTGVLLLRRAQGQDDEGLWWFGSRWFERLGIPLIA